MDFWLVGFEVGFGGGCSGDGACQVFTWYRRGVLNLPRITRESPKNHPSPTRCSQHFGSTLSAGCRWALCRLSAGCRWVVGGLSAGCL